MENWQIKLKTEQEIGSRRGRKTRHRKTEEQTDKRSEIAQNRKNDKITHVRQRERQTKDIRRGAKLRVRIFLIRPNRHFFSHMLLSPGLNRDEREKKMTHFLRNKMKWANLLGKMLLNIFCWNTSTYFPVKRFEA